MRAEHAFHEEVGAGESVETHAVARLAEKRSNSHRLTHRGHVALLASLLAVQAAVQPLEIRHLLGKLADWFAIRAVGRSVQSVTTAAQAGIANMVGLCQ